MALHEYQKHMYKKFGVIAALIVLPIAGFFVGVQYQKQTSSADRTGVSRFANGPRGTMLRNHAFGTVKSISGSSITITERFNDTDKTYTLTAATTFKNGTANAQASDIKTGDTVMLTLDSSDNTKVTTAVINPTMTFRGTDNDNSPSTVQDDSGNTMLQ